MTFAIVVTEEAGTTEVFDDNDLSLGVLTTPWYEQRAALIGAAQLAGWKVEWRLCEGDAARRVPPDSGS